MGNRDDLILAFTHRFVAGSLATLAVFQSILPRENRVGAMLDELFGSEEAFDRDENLVADALIAEANQLEGVAQLLSRWFEGFIRFVEQELQREYPKARPSQRRAAALGIVSTFLVMGSLRPMTNSAQHRRAARRAADQLVETLGTGRSRS